MSNCYNKIANFEFGAEEIKGAVARNGLLSMEIEFSLVCNFRCQYCYVPNADDFSNELSKEELKDIILQAKALGAKKIIILGGEPMLYPHIMEMIGFIRENAMAVEMFTNGTNIDKHNAKKLFDYNVTVVLKINSFKEKIQDKLAGVKGAYKIIWDAFNNLLEAGYPSKESVFGVSTVICKQNFDELFDMWKWLRQRNIVPYFEMITPQGKAKDNDNTLEVNSDKVKELFFKIAEFDQKEYGQAWEPQPPLVGNKCLRHQFSCLVNSKGLVMPCVGVTIPVGNVREKKLAQILNDSEVIQNLRNYRKFIKEPCQSCNKSEDCYGCRGAAFQLTGDYLASDPLCWKNAGRQHEITTLPIDVGDLIPQKPPMRLIEKLTKVGEKYAEVATVIKKDMFFVDNKGFFDESAFMELIAQAVAAYNGFEIINCPGAKFEGFLLGAKKLHITGRAKVGDHLRILVFKSAGYGDFGIIKGEIYKDKELICAGEIKVWHNLSSKAKSQGPLENFSKEQQEIKI